MNFLICLTVNDGTNRKIIGGQGNLDPPGGWQCVNKPEWLSGSANKQRVKKLQGAKEDLEYQISETFSQLRSMTHHRYVVIDNLECSHIHIWMRLPKTAHTQLLMKSGKGQIPQEIKCDVCDANSVNRSITRHSAHHIHITSSSGCGVCMGNRAVKQEARIC